ncbi:MAG: F0F1 ATP synthase subunit delta [Oscillospiraceae bacterium]|nr:F0F1 ATP synthase subunit delta [Oscillospiraceae bacterium]
MQEAILKIAPPYDEQEVASISQCFEKLLGKKVQFKIIEEPSLLGGFFAFVDGRVYDYSFSTQLSELHRSLSD